MVLIIRLTTLRGGPLTVKQHRDPRRPWSPCAILAVLIRDIQRRSSERLLLGCMTLDCIYTPALGEWGAVPVGIMLWGGCPVADIINSISAPRLRTHNENSQWPHETSQG